MVEGHAICRHRPATQKPDDGRWVPLPQIQYEYVIRRIIGETTNLEKGWKVTANFQPAARSMRSVEFLALQIILLKHIAKHMQLSVLIRYYLSRPSHIWSPILGFDCSNELYILQRCHLNNTMPIGKASVYDLINEHLKYANEKLHVLMSLLCTIQ